MEQITIALEEACSRIDKLLSDRFPNHSRTYFQDLIEQGCVTLNGKAVKKQTRPAPGDEVEIEFQMAPSLDVTPEPIPLDILYEDDAVLVVTKPAGMVVHPAPGNYSGTFANALTYHCKEIEIDPNAPFRPGIVHRLDKDTSGVLVAAKTLEAHRKLVEQFSSRSVEKTYLAVCLGRPPEGVVSAPIRRHHVKRKEMTISPDGKEAISKIRVVAHKESLSLAEVSLITGRTHQIRVHFRHLNCPILGDPTYGSRSINQKYGLNSQLLHAHKISFFHPLSGKRLTLHSPIPQLMQKYIDMIQ